MRRRLWIILAAGVAGWVYLQGADVARAADGSEGATLLFAAAPAEAVAWFVGLSLAVAVLAGIAAAMSRSPLGGAFAIAVALAFPAIAGGTIDSWLRAIDSSAAYWVLLAETLVWAVLLVGATVVCHALGRRLRGVLLKGAGQSGAAAARAGERHTGAEPFWFADITPEAAPAEAAWRSVRAGVAGNPSPAVGRAAEARGGDDSESEAPPDPTVHSLAGGAVALVAGGGLAAILLQSPDTGQVFWGLLLAFVIAGALAHQFFPALHPLAVLLSPLGAAVIWYGWAAATGGPAEAMLRAYFAGQFTPGALALPIHYASAGVAGAALGLAWSRALHAHEEHEDDRGESG